MWSWRREEGTELSGPFCSLDEQRTGGQQGVLSAAEAGEVGLWVKSRRLCGPVQEALGGMSKMERSPRNSPTNVLPLEVKGLSGTVGVSTQSRAREDRERAEHPSGHHRGSMGLLTAEHLCVSEQVKQSGPLDEGVCRMEAGRWLCVCPHAGASSWAWNAAPTGTHMSYSLFAFMPTDYSSG